MGRNVVLRCLPCPCFSSEDHNASSSSHKINEDTDSSADSEDSPGRAEEVPSCKLVPLPRHERTYPRHAVGIDDQVNRVIQLLEWENETKVAVAVILHGLGGTGKTTLADAVVARLDIGGWNYSTIVLPERMQRNFEDSEGETQLDKQTFIYIDNGMVRGEHLQKLLPNDSFKKKLRLLLTARDETVADVLSTFGIHTRVFPVRPLLSQDAMELVCKKMGFAGTRQTPQIDEILKICDGVPLALERVGSYICESQDKDEAYRRVIEWSNDGKPFNSAEEYSIDQKGLLFDFDELPPSAKESFLDICSFFNGWDWNKVSCIMGEDELNSLRKRALFLNKEEWDNKVMVRHIILTIGRHMTKGKRFNSANDLSKALGGDELDIRGIKGIWLQGNISEPFRISAKKLDLMHDSLRVLALGDMAIVVDGQCTQKFEQIRYFQAGLIPCIPFHPKTSQELRILDWLPHNDNYLQLTKISSKLNVLNLNGVRWDRRFETESTFGRLRGLRTLKLTKFKRLKNLPEELRLLRQLEELDLSGCKKLSQLPHSFGKLRSLKYLDLSECTKLAQLPKGLGDLNRLTKLSLRSCKSLQELPENLGSLISLEDLDLGYCSLLKELPSSFGELSSLKVLTLVGCRRLNHLPDDIRNLSALVRIQFQGSRLVSIPCRSIKLVKNLYTELCRQLTILPKRLMEIKRLRSLDLYCWSSLERLPEGFGQLKLLVELNIQWCSSLEELSSDFHCLASLQTLNLKECEKLEGKWMDSVGKIRTLEVVGIGGSPMLKERWAEMEKGGQSWHFAVKRSYRENWNWANAENMLNKSASKLFTGECLLADSGGKDFSLSTVAPNTLILVLYHYPCRPNVGVNYKDKWKLLEEVVKHEHPLPFQMIYVGKCLDDLSKSIAERIMAYASVDSDAHLFFKKAFYVKFAPSIDYPEFVVTKVVADEEGRKHFSTWERITGSICFEFLLSKSTLYSYLQKLTETPQENSVKLLSALFDSAESTTNSIFLRNYTENIGVDQLHGKRVLLVISVNEPLVNERLIQTLTEIYSKAKTNDDMEILSIPIPAEVRGRYEIEPGSDLAGFDSTLKNVPWPVLRNPWSLKTEVYYFLIGEYRHMVIPAILVVVEPNGIISNKNALPLVERWGAEVYPFTEEKMKQLEEISGVSAYSDDESGSTGVSAYLDDESGSTG